MKRQTHSGRKLDRNIVADVNLMIDLVENQTLWLFGGSFGTKTGYHFSFYGMLNKDDVESLMSAIFGLYTERPGLWIVNHHIALQFFCADGCVSYSPNGGRLCPSTFQPIIEPSREYKGGVAVGSDG